MHADDPFARLRAAPDSVRAHSVTSADGAGIYARSDVTLIDSAVFGNQTFQPNGDGAGIWTMRKVALLDSTVSGNCAPMAGGAGISAMSAGSAAADYVVTPINSTVAANRSNADSPRAASGVSVGSMGQGRIELRSSLVAGNSGVHIVSSAPTVAAGSRSLIGTADAALTLPADTLRCDPRLLPLAFTTAAPRPRTRWPATPARSMRVATRRHWRTTSAARVSRA